MRPKYIGRWMQFGGHADGRPDLAKGALREASEESGFPEHRFGVPEQALRGVRERLATDAADLKLPASEDTYPPWTQRWPPGNRDAVGHNVLFQHVLAADDADFAVVHLEGGLTKGTSPIVSLSRIACPNRSRSALKAAILTASIKDGSSTQHRSGLRVIALRAPSF